MGELYQRLCADVIDDYCRTGTHSECEIVRRCYETFKSLDTYKNYWYLKPWVVGVMLLRLGMLIERKNPAKRGNVGRVKGETTITQREVDTSSQE